MEFFDKLSETIVSAGKDVGQKAKDVSGIAKLKMDIRSKEDFVEMVQWKNSMRNLEKHIMRNTRMKRAQKAKKRHRNRSTFS